MKKSISHYLILIIIFSFNVKQVHSQIADICVKGGLSKKGWYAFLSSSGTFIPDNPWLFWQSEYGYYFNPVKINDEKFKGSVESGFVPLTFSLKIKPLVHGYIAPYVSAGFSGSLQVGGVIEMGDKGVDALGFDYGPVYTVGFEVIPRDDTYEREIGIEIRYQVGLNRKSVFDNTLLAIGIKICLFRVNSGNMDGPDPGWWYYTTHY